MFWKIWLLYNWCNRATVCIECMRSRQGSGHLGPSVCYEQECGWLVGSSSGQPKNKRSYFSLVFRISILSSSSSTLPLFSLFLSLSASSLSFSFEGSLRRRRRTRRRRRRNRLRCFHSNGLLLAETNAPTSTLLSRRFPVRYYSNLSLICRDFWVGMLFVSFFRFLLLLEIC